MTTRVRGAWVRSSGSSWLAGSQNAMMARSKWFDRSSRSAPANPLWVATPSWRSRWAWRSSVTLRSSRARKVTLPPGPQQELDGVVDVLRAAVAVRGRHAGVHDERSPAAHPRHASTSSWARRNRHAPSLSGSGRAGAGRARAARPTTSRGGRLATVTGDAHGRHASAGRRPRRRAPRRAAHHSRRNARSVTSGGAGTDRRSAAPTASEPGGPAHRPSELVPRGAHVGRSLGDEGDRPVEEHRSADRLQPTVGAQHLARHGVIRLRRAPGRPPPRSCRGGAGRAASTATTTSWSADLVEPGRPTGTECRSAPAAVGPPGQRGRPARVGRGARPHEHPRRSGREARPDGVDRPSTVAPRARPTP